MKKSVSTTLLMVGTLVFGLIGPFPVWAKSIEETVAVARGKTVTPEEESVTYHRQPSRCCVILFRHGET
jgi:hypothetical protein